MQNQILLLNYQLFCSTIVPTRVFFEVQFRSLPTVFNKKKIKRWNKVEEILQVIFLFPLLHNIVILALEYPLSISFSNIKSCFFKVYNFTISSKI